MEPIRPPETITRSKLKAMMDCLGLGDYWEDLVVFHADPESVFIEIVARNEDGKVYAASGSNDLAVHRFSIQVDPT